MLERIETLPELRKTIANWRKENLRIGFVPTMGALHAGHITLVREALKVCDRVVVSIFVNPTQFAPNEDLDKYPRTLEADLEKLTAAGAHAVWLPDVQTMYPDGFCTTVSVRDIAKPLEGAHRPHFFDGVATVVSKLFLQVMPDAAFFGEKDYQQLLVVRRMTLDLNISIEVAGVPTVRDDHGLALSSRNAYLEDDSLAIARRMNKILRIMAEKIMAGMSPVDAEVYGGNALLDAGFTKIDYCAVCDATTLQPAIESRNIRILAAAWLNSTRLIDNIGL